MKHNKENRGLGKMWPDVNTQSNFALASWDATEPAASLKIAISSFALMALLFTKAGTQNVSTQKAVQSR